MMMVKSVEVRLTTRLLTSARPKWVWTHMVGKFSQARRVGNQTGGNTNNSSRGFRAVKIMTANGKRLRIASGSRKSQ